MIYDNIKEFAAKGKIAAVSAEGELSFAQLDAHSDAIAAYLLENYPGKAPVMIWCDKENEYLSIVIACLKSAHPYIPVASNSPAEKAEQIIADCCPCVAVTAGGIPFPTDKISCIGKDELAGIIEKYSGRTVGSEFGVKPEDVVCIFYTSGSTGKPKGIMTKAKNIAAYQEWITDIIGDIHEYDRLINFVPYSFAFSMCIIFFELLVNGFTLYAVGRDMLADKTALMDCIFKVDAHNLLGTPSFAKMLLGNAKFNRENLPSLTYLTLGGESLPKALAQELLDRFPGLKLVSALGSTETTLGIFCCILDEEMISHDDEIVPIGKDEKKYRYSIVDEDGNPVPDGEPGELIIESELVVDGYFNDPEQTEKVFYRAEDGMMGYRTKDIVRSSNGLIYHLGRADNMIKVGGYRVELEDVDNALSGVSCIAQAIAVPAVKEKNCLWLDAYVILKPGTEPSLETTVAIKKELAGKIQPYMIPQRIYYVSELPKNANGKIDRMALKEKSKLA